MHPLNSFPTEVLDLVAGFLDATEISRLLQVGDRNIWHWLTVGPSKRLRLSWTSATWLPWPVPFLRYFRELAILEWSAEDLVTRCPKLDLSVLPPSLKRLCIDAEDIFCLLRFHKCRLEQQFPNLTSLELHGARINPENLEHLPPTLTALLLDSGHSRISVSNFFGKLPRSLRSLDLLFHVVARGDLGASFPLD